MAVLPPASSVTIPKKLSMRCSPRHGSTRPSCSIGSIMSSSHTLPRPLSESFPSVPGLVQGPSPWQRCRCHPGSWRQARDYPSRLHRSRAANRCWNELAIQGEYEEDLHRLAPRTGCGRSHSVRFSPRCIGLDLGGC